MNINQLENVSNYRQYFTSEWFGILALLTVTAVVVMQLLSGLFLFFAMENILNF